MAIKIGAEDKKKVAIAAVLGVVVLGLVIYNLVNTFGGGSTPTPVAQSPAVVPAPATPARAPASAGRPRVIPGRAHEATKISGPLAGLDPTLHPEVMAQAESIEYTGKGRNIFSMFSEPVIEAAKGPIRPEPVTPVQTGPPPPPPIDLKFFGYETHQGGRKAFLLHGDDIFVAAEGDVVDHHYRVVKIAPLSVQIEDIPYNNTQTLPLIQN
jgi:hypothetical protein